LIKVARSIVTIVVTHPNRDMKNILSILSLLMVLAFVSCKQSDPNEQIDEGTVKDNTYTSQEIGWTIKIPEGWSVVEKEETEAHSEKGLKAMEASIEGEINFGEFKSLIVFQKNQFNLFQSSSESFEITHEDEWEENNEALKELLYITYTNQGIKVDTSSSEAIIDELKFDVFHITMYGEDDEVILYQDMFSRHMNGFIFGVNLNYNNDQDKQVMMDAWKNSTFKKD